MNTIPAEAYRRLGAQHPMAGLLMVQQSEPVAAVIDELLLIWSATEAADWQSRVCFLQVT